eukprot:jgi/Mesen1/10076/ME000074S09416
MEVEAEVQKVLEEQVDQEEQEEEEEQEEGEEEEGEEEDLGVAATLGCSKCGETISPQTTERLLSSSVCTWLLYLHPLHLHLHLCESSYPGGKPGNRQVAPSSAAAPAAAAAAAACGYLLGPPLQKPSSGRHVAGQGETLAGGDGLPGGSVAAHGANLTAPIGPPSTQNEPRSVISRQGVVQNPSGWHQGQRVWGGGIVKVRRRGQPQASSSAPGRRTESAFGHDLTAIEAPALLPGEGNVHSGAPAPWLAQGEAAGVTPPPLVLSRSQERKLARLRNPKRVGAAWAERRRAELAAAEVARREELQQLQQRQQGSVSIAGVGGGLNSSVGQVISGGAGPGQLATAERPGSATWLPSFGRVWQSGSRSDSLKEHEAAEAAERKRKQMCQL